MDFSKLVEDDFHRDMREELSNIPKGKYISFERAFLEVLSHHAPWEQKVFRANHKPYVKKQLRKANITSIEPQFIGRHTRSKRIIVIDCISEREKDIIPI